MANLLRRRPATGTRDADTHIIRGLGLHESYQLAVQTLDQYRGTVVRFYEAVVRVVLAQPHMQTGVVGETSKKPKLVRLDKLKLRNHVDWVVLDGSDDPNARYLEELQTNLDTTFSDLATQPGWRVVVLHQAGSDRLDVIYLWSHTHHDGMSGKMFHQQLLRNLNTKVDSGTRLATLTQEDPDQWIIDLPDSSNKLPPPPEHICAFPTTVPFLAKNLFKELKPPAIFPPGDTYALWAPIKTSPFKTWFHTFTLGHETVAKVVDACRQHQTTVTGLLHVLVLLSLTSGLKDAKGFASRTPYNLRPILPSHPRKYPWLEPKETMCNYVSVTDHVFNAGLVASIRAKLAVPAQTKGEVSEEEAAAGTGGENNRPLSADLLDIVWSTSARVRREIKDRLTSGVKNDLIGIMKFAPEWKALMKNEARKPRFLSWLVTNVGVLDGREGAREVEVIADAEKTQTAETQERGEEGEDGRGKEDGQGWSICRGELLLSADVASAAIQISVMTAQDEQMAVTCSWQDCVVDPGLGRCLVDDLERWLNEIGSSA
ncbi:hypothetical protein PG999_012932 [Apiospora kogelbergensis]|uniref:Alcohol acetyltransferase n=1 Tax=Apiospora kogelbergensis TaxID=1337665 RepID=A0AAW0Q8F9_9PEZI